MSTLWVMELSRQLCGKMRRSTRKAQLSSSPTSTWGLEIHFYLPEVHQLEYFKGCYTVEELCVEAAKKCCKWQRCWQASKIKNRLLCLFITSLFLKKNKLQDTQQYLLYFPYYDYYNMLYKLYIYHYSLFIRFVSSTKFFSKFSGPMIIKLSSCACALFSRYVYYYHTS